MSYAYVTSGTIQAVGGIPTAARRLDTGQWVLGLPDAPVDTQQACGWFAVVDTPRPADTDTTTHDRSVELVAAVPTVVWAARPWTVDELAARQATANQSTIDAAITQALAELDTLIAAPAVAAVPDGTLTTAQLSNAMRSMRDAVQQNRAGAQRVARTLKQTIRLVRGDFDDVD
jgi:hypothetical protein